MDVSRAGKSAIPKRVGVALQGGIEVREFLIIIVQLSLLMLVLRQFQIENSAFIRLALLTFAGFVVHAVLPMPYRLPFFLVLSLAGIGLVLGVTNGLWLVGIGLILIGICHLPLASAVRTVLLLLLGGLLVVLRVDWLHAPWSQAVWPILGSMFMFRLIAYYYDLRHDNAPVSVWRTLSYFFLLPNVCFPLFPVVDYKTFRRNYYNTNAYGIYQVGVEWMVRGVIHLLLYRFVYYYLTLSPSEVTNPGDLVRYLVSTFLLYLRVSGQFHLIVGMLHLFGFHLPETHHRYYLATSFTDFWRRINIYWKDFMLKVFYYPAYFQLRRWGPTPALIVSTFFVFAVTWFLHAYQWFWLRGTFLLSWPDVLFWTILACLVVLNALHEAKHGRERTLSKASWTWRSATTLTMKTLGTFSVICLLWSFWACESLSTWWALWRSAGEWLTADARLGLPLLIAAVVIGGTTRDATGGGGGSPQKRGQRTVSWVRSPAATMVLLVLLVLLGIERVHMRLGTTVGTVIQSLRSGKLNRLDRAMLDRGYYENLLRVDRFNSQLSELYMKKPAKWLDQCLDTVGVMRFTTGFAQTEFIPSVAVPTYYGMFSINRWGMRDQDYEQYPAPNTYRIALLGASAVMGWGVADGQTFEALLESRLNREWAGKSYEKYAILNFALPNFQPPQQLVMFEKALTFKPQAVFYVAAGYEMSRAQRYLIEVVQKGITIPYAPLRVIMQKAGIEAQTEETEAHRRLRPFQGEILAWIYQHIVEECRARGIRPVWAFVPQVRKGVWEEETPEVLQIAKTAGFITVNLADVFKNQDLTLIRLAEWDEHPNTRGHQLIADQLYAALQAKQDIIFSPPVTAEKKPIHR